MRSILFLKRNLYIFLILSFLSKREGFPDKPEKAYKIIKKDISKKNNMIIEFNGLYYQEYAIAVLHDEDGNNKMKTGIFGMPKEG